MSAKNLKFSAARAAWPGAWVSGSPVSNVSSSAIRPARASMPSAIWLRIRARARARILNQIADGIEARAGRIAELETFDTGLPLTQAPGQAARAAENFRFFAGMVETD